MPGTVLSLWGPLGHGFRLPANLHRLGLIAIGNDIASLAPLAELALVQGTAVTLFTDCSAEQLPAALEVYPLGEYPSLATWPDFLAIDLPLENLPAALILGLSADIRSSCRAVLVH
jgi:hypothetical protein